MDEGQANSMYKFNNLTTQFQVNINVLRIKNKSTEQQFDLTNDIFSFIMGWNSPIVLTLKWQGQQFDLHHTTSF